LHRDWNREKRGRAQRKKCPFPKREESLRAEGGGREDLRLSKVLAKKKKTSTSVMFLGGVEGEKGRSGKKLLSPGGNTKWKTGEKPGDPTFHPREKGVLVKLLKRVRTFSGGAWGVRNSAATKNLQEPCRPFRGRGSEGGSLQIIQGKTAAGGVGGLCTTLPPALLTQDLKLPEGFWVQGGGPEKPPRKGSTSGKARSPTITRKGILAAPDPNRGHKKTGVKSQKTDESTESRKKSKFQKPYIPGKKSGGEGGQKA